eukprot:3736742-Rhodomonas_salina.2
MSRSCSSECVWRSPICNCAEATTPGSVLTVVITSDAMSERGIAKQKCACDRGIAKQSVRVKAAAECACEGRGRWRRIPVIPPYAGGKGKTRCQCRTLHSACVGRSLS